MLYSYAHLNNIVLLFRLLLFILQEIILLTFLISDQLFLSNGNLKCLYQKKCNALSLNWPTEPYSHFLGPFFLKTKAQKGSFGLRTCDSASNS